MITKSPPRKATSYQQRKKEIAQLEKQVSILKQKLDENGIEFGQLAIDGYHEKTAQKPSCDGVKVDIESRPPPPKPPLSRVMREGVTATCTNCHSTMSRTGFLHLFGPRKCDNNECPNSK